MTMHMLSQESVYVAGHTGLVGSALMRRLKREGCRKIVTRPFAMLDLRDKQAVDRFFETERPAYVFLAAAKVGGIAANMNYPAFFIYDNVAIALHVIDAAYRYGVKKLLFLGSSCIYPRHCPQPIKEKYLLTGELEQSNEPYAIAKITGLKLCQSYNRQYGTHFITCMPTNLYGPYDNFDLENAHVVPALIRKFYEAKLSGDCKVVVWGTGQPLREFMYVDDLADACVFLMKHYEGNEPINVGTGQEISIADLAHMIQGVVGYKGDIIFDTSKPDGTPRKVLSIDTLTALGWHARTPLYEGIQKTVAWYASNFVDIKKVVYENRV